MGGPGWWQAWARRLTKAKFGAEHAPNLLAISDLHLGHDLKQGVDPSRLEPSPIDTRLGALFDHYATLPSPRPWRLLIVGDMVDFIGITLTPSEDEQVPFEPSEEERVWGLRCEPARSEWMLRKVFVRHRSLFEAMARFVAAGNEVVIIRGNHDPDWRFPRVQEAMREHLATCAGDPSAGDRVRFLDWFYLEPGRIFAEHGHLHDEFSAEPHPDAGGERVPLSTLAMRYFGNRHITPEEMDHTERWTATDYARWAFRTGNVPRIAADYLHMCGRIIGATLKASAKTLSASGAVLARRREDDEPRLAPVREALRDFRHEREEAARELVRIWRHPASEDVMAAARMLYVDRIALGLVTCGLIAGCATLPGPRWLRGSLAGGTVAAAAWANAALGRVRRVDSHPKQIAAAGEVARLFGVRHVVMGHSHRVVSTELGGGARYVNLGAWLKACSPHEDGEGFPHLVVVGESAELRRWKLPPSDDTRAA